VTGTNVGFAMAHDYDSKGRYTGRVARKWQAIRSKSGGYVKRPAGLTGADLETAVMGIAMADPSLVKFGAR
jgi:hypothetical protein